MIVTDEIGFFSKIGLSFSEKFHLAIQVNHFQNRSELKDFPDLTFTPCRFKVTTQKHAWPGFRSHIFLVVKDIEKFNVIQNCRDKSGCQTSKQNSSPSRDKVFSHEMRDLKMYDPTRDD